MNIICNNCVGARIYQILNKEYNNPFMWSIVLTNDFINLISKYNEFDFSKYKVSITNSKYAKIVIDDKINVLYIHYIQDKKYDTPTKMSNILDNNSLDIRYNKIIEYTNDKYEKRYKRLLANDDEPLFIYDLLTQDFNRINIERILNIETNNKIIILQNTDKIKKRFDIKKNNIEIIRYSKKKYNLTSDRVNLLFRTSNLLKEHIKNNIQIK